MVFIYLALHGPHDIVDKIIFITLPNCIKHGELTYSKWFFSVADRKRVISNNTYDFV